MGVTGVGTSDATSHGEESMRSGMIGKGDLTDPFSPDLFPLAKGYAPTAIQDGHRPVTTLTTVLTQAIFARFVVKPFAALDRQVSVQAILIKLEVGPGSGVVGPFLHRGQTFALLAFGAALAGSPCRGRRIQSAAGMNATDEMNVGGQFAEDALGIA